MLGSQNKKLRKKREDALSSITGDRVNIELMAQRARPADDPLDRDLLQTVLNNIAAIETGARNADSVTELDDLIADGESQGIASAYFCQWARYETKETAPWTTWSFGAFPHRPSENFARILPKAWNCLPYPHTLHAPHFTRFSSK